MLFARVRCDMSRLCDTNALSRRDAGADRMIPATQVFKRYAEAICDGDERIAAARAIDLSMRCRRGHWSNGNDERIDVVESVVGVELIGCCQLLDGDAIAVC